MYSLTGDSDCKEFACNAGDLGSIAGLGRSPGGGHGSPLQYSCLKNPHGQRSVAGYSLWGHRESDTTERLSTQHTSYNLRQSIFSNNHCLPIRSCAMFFNVHFLNPHKDFM